MYFKFFPNILSFSRIVITPFIVIFIIKNTFVTKVISLVLFFIGSFTDFLDGYIARKYNIKSTLGTYLDPLADKFLILVTFCLLVYLYPNQVKVWMIVAMFLRDLLVTIYRKLLINNDFSLKTSKYAKLKTFYHIFVIHIILFLHIINPSYIIVHNHIYLLTLTCVMFSILTAFHYFWINLVLHRR